MGLPDGFPFPLPPNPEPQPPTPTDPPPSSAVWPVRVAVWHPPGTFHPIAHGRLQLDDDNTEPVTGVIVEDGRMEFALPQTSPACLPGWGATLTMTLQGETRTRETRLILERDINVAIEDRIVAALPRLRAVGEFFYTTDYTPFRWIGSSSFALQQVFDADPNAAAAVLDQLATLGFNAVRVFTRFRGGLGRYDGNLASLAPLANLAASKGLYVEYVVSADAPAFGTTTEQERERLIAIVNAVADRTNVLLECVNEGDHPANKFPGINYLPQPTAILSSRGSGMSDQLPMLPVFDGAFGYATYHPGRTFDFARKVGHNAWEDVAQHYDCPVVSNEIMRPDECDFDTESYFSAGANAALFIAGAVFHSQEGKAARLITDGRTLACAESFVYGMASLPYSVQNGRYTAGHLHDCPMDGAGLPNHARIHGKIVSASEAWCVIAPPPPAGWLGRAKNGWRITHVDDSGLVYKLER